MKRNIQDILREWFYILPNGYAIPPYDDMELQVLSKILTEASIDPKPILESLRGDMPIREAEPKMTGKQIDGAKKATSTTVTHETYFAIAMAWLLDNSGVGATQPLAYSPKTEEEFVELSKQVGNKLKDSEKTIQSALDYMRSTVQTKDQYDKTKKPKKWDRGYKEGDSVYYTNDGGVEKLGPVFHNQWEDAARTAARVKTAMDNLYNPAEYISSLRVATTGTYGVADDVVTITLQNGKKDDVHISLKYGEGQFSSISINMIFIYLFGFNLDIQGAKRNGILRYIYEKESGGAAGIDKALESYIENINDFLNTTNPLPKKIQAILDHNKKLLNNNTGQVPSDTPWGKWDSTMGQKKGSVAYNYRKIYDAMNKDNGGLEKKEAIRIDRAKYLHPAIEGLINKIDNQQFAANLTDFISYVLRADPDMPDKSYIYVAEEGTKLISLPSKEVIRAKVDDGNFEVDLGPVITKTASDDILGDYIQMIQMKGDGQKLVDIPLVLRFANGQWTSDYAQKGKAPTFYPYFEKFFGASVPGLVPKGEVE